MTGKRTIALDGKTLRGSFDHLNDRAAAHVLSAFASDAALILAHQEVAGAPGEIPAVPTLITELGVSGVLFTADALHCQKDSFTRAAETGNGLLVQVKRNQPTLHETLARLCAERFSVSATGRTLSRTSRIAPRWRAWRPARAARGGPP